MGRVTPLALALAACAGAPAYDGIWERSAIEATAFTPPSAVSEACLAVEEELVLDPDGTYDRVRRLAPAGPDCDGVDEALEREAGLWTAFDLEEDGEPFLVFELEHYVYDSDVDRRDVELDVTTQRVELVALGLRDDVRVLYLGSMGQYLEAR